MSLDPSTISILRNNHPHVARFYMSVFIPNVLYIGQVSGSPARGARSITVVDVSGDISDILVGHTVEVYDPATNIVLSKRRYRSRVGNTITIDENSFEWSNSYYIRVLENYELWAVHPYVDGDPANYVFYKDRDITYTDENKYPPPVAIAGDSRVGFLTSGSIMFYLDGTSSYSVIGATITTYLWSCTGGSITDPNASTTTISFDTPGYYWVSLTVTDDNGKTKTTHRRIIVHDRGANAPYTDFEISSNPQFDWTTGGGMMSVKVFGDATITNFPDNSFVIVWAEQWYAGTEAYYGEHGNIIFAGFIVGETVNSEALASYTIFDIETINGLMDRKNVYSVSIEESDTDPDSWVKFLAPLTVPKAIHHFWQWHSTLFDVTDVFLPIGNVLRMIACDDFENGSLYSVVNSFISEYGIFARVCSDEASNIHVEQDINMLEDADRNLVDTYMELTAVDRKSETDIEFMVNSKQETSLVALSGIAFSTDYVPLFSQFPGSVPENDGSDVYNVERQILRDQNHCNFLSGRVYSRINSMFTEFRMSIAGNYPLHVVPQRWYDISIASTYTNRGIAIDGRIVLRSVTLVIDIPSGTIMPEAVFEMELSSTDGEVVLPPEEPAYTAPNPPGYNPYIPGGYYVPPTISPVVLLPVFGYKFSKLLSGSFTKSWNVALLGQLTFIDWGPTLTLSSGGMTLGTDTKYIKIPSAGVYSFYAIASIYTTEPIEIGGGPATASVDTTITLSMEVRSGLESLVDYIPFVDRNIFFLAGAAFQSVHNVFIHSKRYCDAGDLIAVGFGVQYTTASWSNNPTLGQATLIVNKEQ